VQVQVRVSACELQPRAIIPKSRIKLVPSWGSVLSSGHFSGGTQDRRSPGAPECNGLCWREILLPDRKSLAGFLPCQKRVLTGGMGMTATALGQVAAGEGADVELELVSSACR